MPTQRNYGKYKSSILRDIHQGKDIDLLSTEYYIPQALIKEWVEKEEQDNDLDIVISELSSKSRDRISFFEKNKDCSLLCCYVYSHRNRTEAIDASCVATVQPPFHRYDCHVYKAAARDVHVLPFDINNNGK